MSKKHILVLVFIIITLGLMTYQSNRQRILLFSFLNSPLNSIHYALTSVTDYISAPVKRIMIREEENLRLKAERDNLLKELQSCKEIFIENKKLKEILAIKEHGYKYIATARIIGRSTDQWSNILILDKGKNNGISKDMVAVTEKGLTGKITGVSDSYSYMLLIGDMNFSVAARLQESRTEGIISGTGFKKCQLKYIPYEEKVKKDDIVITSGLDMLFPKGIPIGYVSKINKKDIGFFQDIEVIPFVDTSKIEFVAIIKGE